MNYITQIFALGENAISKIIERMHFLGRTGGYVTFCSIFKLYEKGCLLEGQHEVETACQRCIDAFIKNIIYDMYSVNLYVFVRYIWSDSGDVGNLNAGCVWNEEAYHV